MGPVRVFGEESLRRSVREAGIAVQPVWFDAVGSTNAEALELAKRGAPAWTVVAAGHQTSGRGRLGREWIDATGKSLLVSIIVRPAIPSDHVPVLGLLAALEVIASCGIPDMRAKWPNDLVIGDRKVGGILVEAAVEGRSLRHAVIGVGLNVGMGGADFPPEIRAAATSLRIEGVIVDPETLLTGFLAAFRRSVTRPTESIIEDYRRVCTSLGRRVRAKTTSGEEREGTAVDLDERGGLVIDGGRGRDVVAFGEVEHLW